MDYNAPMHVDNTKALIVRTQLLLSIKDKDSELEVESIMPLVIA